MDRKDNEAIKKLRVAIRNIERGWYGRAYLFVLSVAYYLEEKLVGSKKQ